MKRILPLLAAAALLLKLCGCGGDPSPTPTPASSSPSVTQPGSPDAPDPTSGIEPVPPAVTAAPLPSTTPTPTPEKVPEPERPAESEIAVYYGGNSVTVPAELVRGTLAESAGLGFSIYSDAETYELDDSGNSVRFVPRSGDEDKGKDKERDEEPAEQLTFMELIFIDGATVQKLAPNFMELYLEFDEVEFSANRTIGLSALDCDTVIAYNSGQFVTAFLCGRSGGVAAFVISCSTADNDYHRPRFTAMLETIALFDEEA